MGDQQPEIQKRNSTLGPILADSVANFSGGSVVPPIKDWQLDLVIGIWWNSGILTVFWKWVRAAQRRGFWFEGVDVERCVGHGERKGKCPDENSSVWDGAQSISTSVSGLHPGWTKQWSAI